MIIRFGVRVGICKQEEDLEFPDDELSGLTEDDRQAYLQNALNHWLPNYMDSWAIVVEDQQEPTDG